MIDEKPSVHTDSKPQEATPQATESWLLSEDVAAQVAEMFKALADPTRVRIIGLLAHAEFCVGDLARILGMSQPAVSHQLRVLRNLRIVRARKSGRHVHYTLMDEHIRDLFEQGLAHIRFG